MRSRDAATERTSPVQFYRQVVAELRKVVWPTQQQLITYFFVVHGVRAVHDGARLAGSTWASASWSSRSSASRPELTRARPGQPPSQPGR